MKFIKSAIYWAIFILLALIIIGILAFIGFFIYVFVIKGGGV